MLLETDVLLDVATARQPHGPDSEAQWCQDSARSAVLAWNTIALYYLLRDTNDRHARTFISNLLHFSDIAPAGKGAVQQALSLGMSDFEDALHFAAAAAADVQFIVTRNVGDYRNSPLPVITAHDFVRRFLT